MIKTDNNFLTKKAIRFYFFSDLIKYSTKNKKTLFFVLLIIASIFLCNVILFLNRIKLWVYFNKRKHSTNSFFKKYNFLYNSNDC